MVARTRAVFARGPLVHAAFGAVISSALGLLPATASAQAEPTLEQRREAQMAYSRAQALRAGTQHAEAAALYETADRLAPSVQALGNAIRSHKDCRTPDHDARAATLALRLQSRYGSDPRFAGYAGQVIAELTSSLVRVSVSCEGCETESDGQLQPATEFFVTPGSHRIVAHWPGGRSRDHRMNNARAGTSENVTLQPPAPVSTGTEPTGLTGSNGSGTGSNGTSGTGSSGTSGTGSSGSGTTGSGTTGSGSTGSGDGTTGTGSTGTGSTGDGSGGTSGTGGTGGTGDGNSGSGNGDPIGSGIVRPPPGRGGIHPAVFLTFVGLTAVSGGILAWSGVDTLGGVPAYMMAAQQGDRSTAEMLLTQGQGKELRTNVLIGVTSGLGAVAVGTLIFTRWGAPRTEQSPTAMIVPVPGPLPSVALWGRF
jgi:hypothetical protein